MIKFIRYILLPVVPIYYLVTWVRNKLYDWNLKKTMTYDFPVICVGNLSVGGTGKTPMIEYLVRLLKPNHRVATLSRGYKRQTRGFVLADRDATAMTIGDEPFQFHHKFKDIIVSVDENRVRGISKLKSLPDSPEVILLDDAYQHRKVKAGFSILLTAYNDLYTKDIVLPTGNLREPRKGADRADVIVVTKCPQNISHEEKQRIKKDINALEGQDVFFGSIAYSDYLMNSFEKVPLEILKNKTFTLVTGIANPKPLVDYLEALGMQFEHLKYKDHHEFGEADVNILKEKVMIVTTEKDMMRLQPFFLNDETVYYLSIQMELDRPREFDALLSNFVK